MKLKKLILTLTVLASTQIFAQKGKVTAPATIAAPQAPAAAKEEPKSEAKPAAVAEFKLLGAIGAVYSEDTYGITCLGPKVGFSYGPFTMSVGLYPSVLYSSVIYKSSNPDALVRPNLGFGPEIGWGKVSIIAPIYYMPNNQYRYTIGLAYKF